jgi:dephospho-CoA kinase
MSTAIGLIGGTASGKSEAAHCFQALGIDVIDTDQIAKELVAPGTAMLQKITTYFSPAILLPSGALNRSALRNIIFQNPEAKTWLEHTLHPAIRKRVADLINTTKSPYCIVSIPLLKNRQDYPFLKQIIMIDVPEPVQIKRLQDRDKIDLILARQMLSQQPTRAERLKIADHIIMNDTNLQHLQSQIEALHQKIISTLM